MAINVTFRTKFYLNYFLFLNKNLIFHTSEAEKWSSNQLRERQINTTNNQQSIRRLAIDANFMLNIEFAIVHDFDIS